MATRMSCISLVDANGEGMSMSEMSSMEGNIRNNEVAMGESMCILQMAKISFFLLQT